MRRSYRQRISVQVGQVAKLEQSLQAGHGGHAFAFVLQHKHKSTPHDTIWCWCFLKGACTCWVEAGLGLARPGTALRRLVRVGGRLGGGGGGGGGHLKKKRLVCQKLQNWRAVYHCP